MNPLEPVIKTLCLQMGGGVHPPKPPAFLLTVQACNIAP